MDITDNNKPNIDTRSIINTKALIINNYDKMDGLNKKAALIMLTQGSDAAVKHMFTGDKGEPLTYSEMRERYG